MGYTYNWEYQTSMSGSTTLKVCSHGAIPTVIDFSQLMYCMGFFFKKKLGSLIPCFGLLVTSPLGFKGRVGSLIRTWRRHMWYMFPEVAPRWPAWQPITSPHACFSRGRMPDPIGRPQTYRSDVPTTRSPRPAVWDLLLLSQSHHVNTNIRGFRK